MKSMGGGMWSHTGAPVQPSASYGNITQLHSSPLYAATITKLRFLPAKFIKPIISLDARLVTHARQHRFA
jgi:hypothetical protein